MKWNVSHIPGGMVSWGSVGVKVGRLFWEAGKEQQWQLIILMIFQK